MAGLRSPEGSDRVNAKSSPRSIGLTAKSAPCPTTSKSKKTHTPSPLSPNSSVSARPANFMEIKLPEKRPCRPAKKKAVPKKNETPDNTLKRTDPCKQKATVEHPPGEEKGDMTEYAGPEERIEEKINSPTGTVAINSVAISHEREEAVGRQWATIRRTAMSESSASQTPSHDMMAEGATPNVHVQEKRNLKAATVDNSCFATSSPETKAPVNHPAATGILGPRFQNAAIRRQLLKLEHVAKQAAQNVVAYAHGDIEMEIHNKSPQVAVLWGSANFDRVNAHLERNNIKITHFVQLPTNDRTLFVFERDQKFMDAIKEGGSAASELESLRLAFTRAISLQQRHGNKGRTINFWIWPLHDAIFNRMLLIRALTSDHAKHVAITWQNCIFEVLRRFSVGLGISFSTSDWLLAIQSHFGSDVALAFLFTLHYILTMWVLAVFAAGFHIIKRRSGLNTYRKHWSPIFQFGVLFPWSMFFMVRWKSRVVEASHQWKADLLAEDVTDFSEINPDFTAWSPDENPEYYPNWMRLLKSMAVIPLLILDLVLMSSVLALVFWFEMWIVFDWGKCADINSRNGNNDCQGADVKHGFFGGLFEAVPGLLEGLLFELILALSKALARFAVRLQNWRTRTQQQMAYITQLVFFEFISKFGWIGFLAIIFVPDWDPQEGSLISGESGCTDKAKTRLDTKLFSIIGLEKHSLSCLKSRTQYETRLALFEVAVAAPFFVAQIVSMCIKTMVPSLVVRFRACFPNDHARLNGCYCRCCRFLLRFLSCVCLFDIESVGTDECQYIAKGDPIGEEIYNKTFLADCPDSKTLPPSALLTAMDMECRSTRRAMVRKSLVAANPSTFAASLSPAGNEPVPASPTSSGGVVLDTNRHQPPANDGTILSGEDCKEDADDKTHQKMVMFEGEEKGKKSIQSNDSESFEISGDTTLMTAWAEGIREGFLPLDENLETCMHFFWVISFAAFFPLGVVLAVAVYIFDIRGDLFRLTIIQKRNFRTPPQATLAMLSKFMKLAILCALVFNVTILFVTYMQMSRWSSNPKYRRDMGLNSYFGECLLYCVVLSVLLYFFQLAVMWFFHTGEAEQLATTQNAMRQRRTTRHSNTSVVHCRRTMIRAAVGRRLDQVREIFMTKSDRAARNPLVGRPLGRCSVPLDTE